MAQCSIADTYLFCEQMAMILKSGMSLEEGLTILIEESEQGEFKEALNSCLMNLRQPMSFYEAVLELHYFDDYFVHMIDVGEKSGHLDDVMSECALYYQRMDDTKAKFKEAFTYPFILFLMMFVVLGIIVIQVLPIFQNVLHSLGTSLSGVAYSLMQLGTTLADFGFILLVLVIIAVLGGVLYFRSRYHEAAIWMFLAKFPLTRKLMEEISAAQFAYAMSLLLSSGYDVSEALKSTADLIKHEKMHEKINRSIESVEKGSSFENVVIKEQLFKKMYGKMLHIGFIAGKGDETMSRIASEYEKEVDSSLNRFLNLIEPTLVAVLAILVGIILLSVMLPLMSIMSTIG